MSLGIYGYNPAFYGGQNNILSRQEDEQIIKNDILQLLLTVPGERVHRPTFGTDLRTSVFEPLDAMTLESLKTSIQTAINNFERRVAVVSLDLTQIDNQNEIRILLVVQIVADPRKYITIDYLVTGS